MQQAQSYRAQSRAYLSKAYAELDDDILQASEKSGERRRRLSKRSPRQGDGPTTNMGFCTVLLITWVTETGDAGVPLAIRGCR